MEQTLSIRTLTVGPIGTNCYLLSDGGECCLIDPGDNAPRLLRAVEECGDTLRFILLTHGHFDHYTAIAKLLPHFPELPVYIHRSDSSEQREKLRLCRLAPPHQRFYREGDELTLGSLTIRVMETPGHSAGSVVLQVGNVLFTGDTLFAGTCGRTDLDGGDIAQMRQSLRRLASLEGDYFLYPGHGAPTTLAQERYDNPTLVGI